MWSRLLVPSVLLVLLVSTSACERIGEWAEAGMNPLPLDPAHRSYAGTWQGDAMELRIAPDGRVRYRRTTENGKRTLEAPLRRFDGHDLVVGVGALTTTFVVSRPPTEIDGEWTMVVDGVELRRTSPHFDADEPDAGSFVGLEEGGRAI